MSTSIEDFVLSFSAIDEPKIAFAWNGKYAEEFVDKNIDFRREVCAYFVRDKSVTPLALIASLYKAETQFAKEAWGVNRLVSILAQEMLERGGPDYLQIYIDGAGCGFDAYLESGNIQLSPMRSRELLEHCQALVDYGPAESKPRNEMFVQRFLAMSQAGTPSRRGVNDNATSERPWWKFW